MKQNLQQLRQIRRKSTEKVQSNIIYKNDVHERLKLVQYNSKDSFTNAHSGMNSQNFDKTQNKFTSASSFQNKVFDSLSSNGVDQSDMFGMSSKKS